MATGSLYLAAFLAGALGLGGWQKKDGCLRNGIEKILARSSRRQDEAASTVASRLKDVQKPRSF